MCQDRMEKVGDKLRLYISKSDSDYSSQVRYTVSVAYWICSATFCHLQYTSDWSDMCLMYSWSAIWRNCRRCIPIWHKLMSVYNPTLLLFKAQYRCVFLVGVQVYFHCHANWLGHTLLAGSHTWVGTLCRLQAKKRSYMSVTFYQQKTRTAPNPYSSSCKINTVIHAVSYWLCLAHSTCLCTEFKHPLLIFSITFAHFFPDHNHVIKCTHLGWITMLRWITTHHFAHFSSPLMSSQGLVSSSSSSFVTMLSFPGRELSISERFGSAFVLSQIPQDFGHFSLIYKQNKMHGKSRRKLATGSHTNRTK